MRGCAPPGGTSTPCARCAPLLIAQAIAFVFFEAAAPIEVVFAKITLRAGDGGYGLLITTWGAGVVLGSILFARWHGSLRVMISAGTLAVGLAYLGFSAAPSLAVACVAAVVGGVGNGLQWAPLISAVQRLTPAPLRGRVMGALESIGALFPAIGLAMGGAIVALSSARVGFLVLGIGGVLVTVLFARVHTEEQAPSMSEEQLDTAPIADGEQMSVDSAA